MYETFINWDEAMAHAITGIILSCCTFLVTVALELLSVETVKRVLNQKGAGMPLYIAAIHANLTNHFVFGWPIYCVAATVFCRKNQEFTLAERVVTVSGIVFVHSILFYIAHRSFHLNKELYKHHRFHHRFNIHVPPMAANAVSPVEYVVAYIMPFTVGTMLTRPDPISLQISVAIVAMTNLLIHMPKLVHMSEKFIPVCFVSTMDHLEHHRKLNIKYAAPTFNIDNLVSIVSLGFGLNEPTEPKKI